MTLSISQQVRNRDLIDYAFAKSGGTCYFCENEIDRSVVGLLRWHHIEGPRLGEIGKMFTKVSPTKLEQELKKCVPAHRECHNKHHENLGLTGSEVAP
jgi:hypothetical protein